MIQSIVDWLVKKGAVSLKPIKVYVLDDETLKMLKHYRELVIENQDLKGKVETLEYNFAKAKNNIDIQVDEIIKLRKYLNSVVKEYESQIDFYENKRKRS